MICPNCKKDNTEGNIFCDNCGSMLNVQKEKEKEEIKKETEKDNEDDFDFGPFWIDGDQNKKKINSNQNNTNNNTNNNNRNNNQNQTNKSSGVLVFGIVSFCISLFLLCIPFIPQITSIILSIFAITGYKKEKEFGNSGKAAAGLVFGIIGLVISVVMLTLFIIAICSASFISTWEEFLDEYANSNGETLLRIIRIIK